MQPHTHKNTTAMETIWITNENANSVRDYIESSLWLPSHINDCLCISFCTVVYPGGICVNDPTFVRLFFRALNLIRIETETVPETETEAK